MTIYYNCYIAIPPRISYTTTVADSIERQTEIDRLDAEIATLSPHIDAATHRLLTLIRRFDELGGWAGVGLQSCADWLSWRVGMTPGAARERVRAARALAALPKMDAAFKEGRLSYSKVRAMTRVATPENEEKLVEMARCATGAQLEKICRGARSVQDKPVRHEERSVQSRPLESGLVRITADLHADEAALVMKAIETARRVAGEKRMTERADGLVRVAEGFLTSDPNGEPRPAPERQEIVIELGPETLEDGYRAALDDGTRVPAETFRRVACDCSVSAVVTDGAGRVVDAGARRSRVVSSALRRALRHRDPTCTFPGCTNKAFLDAHHVKHWFHGGETTLENTTTLCRPHHTLVHEGGFTVARDDGVLVFRNPVGAIVDPNPKPAPMPPEPVEALLREQEALDIDEWTATTEAYQRHPDYGACVAAVLLDDIGLALRH